MDTIANTGLSGVGIHRNSQCSTDIVGVANRRLHHFFDGIVFLQKISSTVLNFFGDFRYPSGIENLGLNLIFKLTHLAFRLNTRLGRNTIFIGRDKE